MMKSKDMRILAVILALGLIAAVAVSLVTCIVRKPAITQQEFPYSVTYQLDGETHTLEGIYHCRFAYTGHGSEPLVRYYEGTYLTNPDEVHPGSHTIAEKDGLELCIVTVFFDRYLMGDTKGEPDANFRYDPYLAVLDRDSIEYVDEQMLGQFDAELISWELPEPVENSFVFAGFSHLHDDSMFATVAVGILVILASMIFVKKDPSIAYKALDKVSTVVNFIMVLAVLPIITAAIWFAQILDSGVDFLFCLTLCMPAVMAFSVAVSIALRRNGFRKSGFFVQFVGPVLMELLLLLGR